MSDAHENAEERKRSLIARSTLHRLALQREIEALRGSLRSPSALLSVAALPPVRSLIFGSLLLLAGRSGIGKLIRAAMTLLALVKAGRAAGEWMKSRRGPDSNP
jgi:hypothetical protein